MMQPIQRMMARAGCSAAQIRRFGVRVQQFLSGFEVSIPEADIVPVEDLPRLSDLQPQPELLKQVAIVKLNGGLGTSMGLTGPKGLLEVKDGKDFYDILFQQVKSFLRTSGFQPPLLLMNSFNTSRETTQRLKELGLAQALPWEFLQSQIPKIKPDGTLPGGDEAYAWCPPGHGDIYASLLDLGLIETLLKSGIRFLFVSNIDNLGAVLDSRPLVYMMESRLAFVMEVTRRGENDRKGGHLAKDRSGRLLLREVAQCPDSDLIHFQNIQKHRYFNTNNLWIDLEAIHEGWTELPLIINRKPYRPQDPSSTPIVQLEQAMGAAIGVVENGGAIDVGRDRFLPVKTTNDLFIIRSDLYSLDEGFNLIPRYDHVPTVELDPEHFKMIQGFERLVRGVPSLKECRHLRVTGPVTIDPGMDLSGDVHLF
jgi:UTP--glucose-1-phosphate uridylyltransferase